MYIKRLNQQESTQCHFEKRNKSHASKSCQRLRNTVRTGLLGHEQHLEGDSLWAPEWKGAVGRGNSLGKYTAWYRGINEHQTADMGESGTKGEQPSEAFHARLFSTLLCKNKPNADPPVRGESERPHSTPHYNYSQGQTQHLQWNRCLINVGDGDKEN